MAYLFSREDLSRTHAVLGFSSLLNFLIQYYNIWFYGKMTKYQNFLIPMHLLLSLSSLKFTLPNKRNEKVAVISPTIIIHTILFSTRGLICYIIHKNTIYSKEISCCICYITIYLADIVIIYYNNDTKSEKTMRYMPHKYYSVNRYKILQFFYSGMQFAATISCIKSAESAFATCFPIQLAAFLQTLIRKGKIDDILWHPIYALSLSMALFVNTQYFFKNIEEDLIYTLVGFTSWFMRIYFNLSKYIVWAIGILILNEKLVDLNIILHYEEYINYYLYIIFIVTGISGSLLAIPIKN